MAAKLILAYAESEEGLADELLVHLRQLEKNGLITVWHRKDVAPGLNIDTVVAERFAEAEIIILLLSSELLHYRENDVNCALRRSQERACLVPVRASYA